MPSSAAVPRPPSAVPDAWDEGALRLADTWRPLRYFNLYRTILAGLFVALVLADATPRSLGQQDPKLFFGAAILYLLFGVASSYALRWRRLPFDLQVFGQVLGDIIFLTLLMHASGGVKSGLGMLLLVAVAGGSLLTVGRTAILFAALATLALLGQEVYSSLFGTSAETAYTQSGMLGATFFATALLAHYLAQRVRASEALATQRALDLAGLSRLNDSIIQRMQSGILALDGDDRIQLLNGSARRLLGGRGLEPGSSLAAVSPELASLVRAWRDGAQPGPRFIRPEGAGMSVIASYARLSDAGSARGLVFLEDGAAVNQRAQQLKLLSLGRLAASIAHEIRNPLAAISHASQLLEESPDLPASDRRLTRIIQEQSRRVNAIIENVLQLSRRTDPVSESLRLGPWLSDFREELLRDNQAEDNDIRIEVEPQALQIRMDPVQLHQVVRNLCDNGLRYGRDAPRLRLRAGVHPGTERPFLDVCDSGGGVAEADREHLFEPFFTTERSGSGLGLYIARELCEANQASLEHLGTGEHGHCFRITFSHPKRQGIPNQ